MKRLFFFILITISVSLFITTDAVVAQKEMQSLETVLEIEPINPDYLILNPPPKIATEHGDVKISFIRSTDGTKGFMFSLSSLLIDYGQVSPTNPITRQNTISIKNTASPVYSIFITEDGPLMNSNGVFIPDTSCDNGTCSSSRAAPWENTLSFGFGYRCDNKNEWDCNKAFTDDQSFKRFPKSSDDISMTDIMHGGKTSQTKQSVVTYKVNTAPSQQLGNYSNVITYIAVPGY